MNARQNRLRHRIPDQSPDQKVRRPVVYAILGVAVACLALAVGIKKLSRSESSTRPPSTESTDVQTVSPRPEAKAVTPPATTAPATTAEPGVEPAVAPPSSTPTPDSPPLSAESKQLAEGLWNLSANGTMTPEVQTKWKQNLEKLVEGGAASVPALAQLLQLNYDQLFDPKTAASLGYSSTRTAVIDALARIGGPEAISVLGNELQTTASPREIALLARSLETLAPDQYRAQAVEAARQSLAMAVEKQLGGSDVAPLFEVMQKYGGAEIVEDLQRSASHWTYYATLALGNLPDGAGVPSLIEMAQVQSDGRFGPGRLQALQVLTQLAGSNPDARAALVEQARANQISASLWPYLARPLAGDEAHVQDSVLNDNQPVLAQASTVSTHIDGSNQNFFYAPAGGGLTVEQVNQQMALVDELAAVTSSPDALQVLQQTRQLLEQRLQKATTPAPAAPPDY